MPLDSQVFAELRSFGGHLKCTVCGRQAPLNDPAERVVSGGWPKCCDYTMRWITANELAREGVRDAR